MFSCQKGQCVDEHCNATIKLPAIAAVPLQWHAEGFIISAVSKEPRFLSTG